MAGGAYFLGRDYNFIRSFEITSGLDKPSPGPISGKPARIKPIKGRKTEYHTDMSSPPAMPKPNSGTSGADDADLVTAKRVLEIEAEALGVLAGSLGEPFLRALDILAQVKGRVVVSGMGKSGHIGHKIASTLSSTGTPALFVHPAEASHGDLGMITTDDAVLALSNSGETSELADLVAYAKRFEIPLICITGGKDSALADAADVALILPASEEACPMGLAPTTSTTVMLALGDAISVALLERKGFSPDEFHVLHPGGKLGHRLIKISDIMHKGEEMPLIDPDALMADALIEMSAKSFGCVGVIGSDGLLLGVITDGDLRRHMSPELIGRKAREVMTEGALSINPGMLAGVALGIMNVRAITNIFVTKDDRPLGILHIHDCLRAGVA